MPEEPSTTETEATEPEAVVAESVARTPDLSNDQQTHGDTEAGDDAAKLRALVIAANPDAVPELIEGDTLDALLGSVANAKAVHARYAAPATPPATPAVPSGSQAPPDYASLSPGAKIAQGLKNRG